LEHSRVNFAGHKLLQAIDADGNESASGGAFDPQIFELFVHFLNSSAEFTSLLHQ
jgi:hypothetical protein